MAKGSQFWGSASGKLGEQVLYRAGGEQRARAYVKNIKNPKTIAQMRNRIVMGNLVAVFDALRPIIRNSFTNRATNQSGWNAFVKANKHAETPIIDPTFNGTGISVPYDMQISKGNILIPSIKRISSGGAMIFGIPFAFPTSDAEYEGTGPLSKSNYLDMLGVLGLPSETKMTVVVANWADEGFTLNSATADADSLSQLDSLGLSIAIQSVSQSLFMNLSADNPELMAAVMFSYTDANGKLQVSTSRITLLSGVKTYVEDYLPGGEIYERVLEKAVATTADVLATK